MSWNGGAARSPRLPVSLIQVVRDPLRPWKTSLQTFERARSLGMEVVVALDSRSEPWPASLSATKEIAHRVIVFETADDWPEGQLNTVLDATNRPWSFLVSDDEEPSARLWEFAQRIPDLRSPRGDPYLWRVRMLAPLPDWSALYAPLDTYQPRFFPSDAIRWPGGFDVLPQSNLEEVNCDLVLWHYTLWSPRSYRERKVREHEQGWRKHWASHPWPPSSDLAYLYEDHPDRYVPLGDFEEQRPCVSFSPEPAAPQPSASPAA